MSTFSVTNGATLEVESFDSEKELCLGMESDGQWVVGIYLTPNKVNELITYLVEELRSIEEPVEIFNVWVERQSQRND